uniref:LTD domain-containing protein n=1 Tax=Pogona vitticeps TaxID=103695 RepID=A0A6J0VBA8_9SAUR
MMAPSLLVASALLVCTLLHVVGSQNHIKNPKGPMRERALLINEVNADNPGEDALEYLELYHSSGQQAPLDGYSVVLYNGNGNTAYYVKPLEGLSTDDQGFLLLGSSAVVPRPKVILPKNTIQNGPDAIALYFGRRDLYRGMNVTSEGLVDALVHKSKASDRADDLVRILTPGVEPFLEDPLFRTTDESLERCQRLGSQWFFQVGAPTPGWDNHCIPFAQLNTSSVLLNEVNPVVEFVELQGLPSTEVKDLVLVFVNGSNQIYFVMEVRGKTSPDGLLLLGSDNHKHTVDLAFPSNSMKPPFGANTSAVALFRGSARSFAVGDTMSTVGLLDALVYTVGERTESKLQDILTHGKPPFHVKEESLSNCSSISRCVCCSLTRDPSAYVLDLPTPGQFNDCPKKRFGQDISLCFQVPDCPKDIPVESEILAFLSLALEKQCGCRVFPAYFKDLVVTCQDGGLVFTAQLMARSVPQLQSLLQALSIVLQSKEAVRFGKWNSTAVQSCSSGANVTESPSGVTSEEPKTIQTTQAPRVELLINEVNPDNPGSREDTEYVELFYPGPAPFELRDYWLVLYNGKNDLAYQVVSLGGHRTDRWGYFLVGSSGVAPAPSIVLPDNTIQNGADAVALYRSTKPIYQVNMPVTAEGLVDAVVYTARGSYRAEKLLDILTPGQSILYENDSHSTQDESLSRCRSLRPRDHSSFQVAEITPFRENACTAVAPNATEEAPRSHSMVINEVGVATGTALYQFVELKGPSGASLKGFSLMFFSGHEAKPYASLQLQGTFGSNGLFVVLPGQSSDGHSHEQLVKPSLWSDPSSHQKSHGVALFRHTQARKGAHVPDEIVEDVVVFSWETGTSRDQPGLPGPIYLIPRKGERWLSLSRCSSCNETFAVSDPTPGLENRCPQPPQPSLDLGMCLLTPNCSLWPPSPPVLASLQRALVRSMEESCFCGVSSCYIQELRFTCLDSILKLSGQILTRSEEQRQLLARWQANFSASPNPFPVDGRLLKVNTACPSPNRMEPSLKGHSFQPWETALIVVGSISLALLLGALAVYYLKRRPHNYNTIEMNDRCEIMADI